MTGGRRDVVAEVLGGESGEALHGDLNCYARSVISAEWPAMRKGGPSPVTFDLAVTRVERADGCVQRHQGMTSSTVMLTPSTFHVPCEVALPFPT